MVFKKELYVLFLFFINGIAQNWSRTATQVCQQRPVRHVFFVPGEVHIQTEEDGNMTLKCILFIHFTKCIINHTWFFLNIKL